MSRRYLTAFLALVVSALAGVLVAAPAAHAGREVVDPCKLGNANIKLWYPWDSPSTSKLLDFAACARMQAGKPYVWGTDGPNSFDCSGLVHYSMGRTGYDGTDRTAQGYYNLYAVPRNIPLAQRRPGDLLFWRDGSGIYHIAIYLGINRDNNVEEIMEALNPNAGVRVSPYRVPSAPLVGRLP